MPTTSPDPEPQSKVHCESIAVDFANGSTALLGRIQIACPECGTYEIVIAGHHLRAIRDFLVETIDRYPERCGTVPALVKREQISFGGGGGNPADN